MTARQFLRLSGSALAWGLFPAGRRVSAAPAPGPFVRLAELDIDPARREDYLTALKEEIETSVRVEPGVLALYAVSVKGHPSQIRIFEAYADEDSYRAHLQTPHFKKYKSGTEGMVKNLRLIETDPIILGAKPRS